MEKEIKNLYYLDRDTNIEKLAESILKKKKETLLDYLKYYQNVLHEREAGEFFPIEDSIKLKDKSIDKTMVFYKSAVIQYYMRQEYDLWQDKLSSEMIERGDKEIKEKVGFILYTIEGKPTGQVNSITNFKQLKEMNVFLKQVENVCFKDNGYMFPDSKHFNNLKNTKGLEPAKLQIMHELKTWYDNQFEHEKI